MDSNAVGKSDRRSIESVLTDQIRTAPRPKAKGKKAKRQALKDNTDINLKEVYKSLTVLANEVLKKLDEILKEELPDGVASLKPEEHTSEKTAQRIVDGATSFMPIFAQQNPELQGEELLKEFMKTIRGGIAQGYAQAKAILGDIGAFKLDGIESAIEETMRLVEEKLQAYEQNYFKKDEKPIEEPAPAVEGELEQVA